jgi:hypothetical protein
MNPTAMPFFALAASAPRRDLSSSVTTTSPNPSPTALVGSPPIVVSRLSYLPPPKIARNSPFVSKHSKTTPV